MSAYNSVDDRNSPHILRPSIQGNDDEEGSSEDGDEKKSLLPVTEIHNDLCTCEGSYQNSCQTCKLNNQGLIEDQGNKTESDLEAVFGWSSAEVSLMQNWLYAMYIVCIFPFMWLIEVKGLRLSVVISAVLVCACGVLRCISMEPPAATWLNNIGHCLLGMSGPVLFTCGPVVSSLWFPPEQRSTATALGTMSGFLGPAVCFLYGPLLVSAPVTGEGHNGQKNITNIHEMRGEMRRARLIECGVCAALLLAVLIYFPSKPKLPPSRTAAMPKLNFVHGLRKLFRRECRNFWLVCFAYGISAGIYGVFSALFTVNFKDIMSQKEIGMLGALSVASGCFAAIFFGRVSDIVSRSMKVMCVVLLCFSVFITFWVLLLVMQYIPLSRVQLYTAIILQGLLINAPIALFYEMACESNYPINEIVTSGVMSVMYNLPPIVFLLIFLIPNIGTVWMNWVMYASIVVCIPLILGFKERYRRFSIDVEAIITIVN